MCIIFICSDRTFIPHQIGFQRINSSSITEAPSIRNGAEKIIDLHGHIVGIAISPDYKAWLYHPLRLHTVPNNRSLTLNLLSKKTQPIFSILDTYWTCPHQQILCTSLALGGAAVNFKLELWAENFLVNSLVKKIGSMAFLSPLKQSELSHSSNSAFLLVFFKWCWK